MLDEVAIILTLIALNGVFAGAEIAILAMRKTRIQQLADRGSRAGTALLALRDEPERLLATVQIGVTVMGATAAAYGAVAFAEPLSARIAELLGEPAHPIGFALVVAGISFAMLVLGELVPKSLALRASEMYALFVGRALLGLSTLLRPAIWVLTGASNLVLRWFNDETTFSETRLSPEELRSVVQEAAQAGSLDERTGEIAARAFDFDQLSVAAVMVPQGSIAAVSRHASAEELRGLLRENDHQRYPVYEGDETQMVGYVRARDALVHLDRHGDAVELDAFLRPALFLPATARAASGLRELQRNRTQLAIVVDEHGDVAGIVTLQDFASELVGDFFKEDQDPATPIEREDDGTAIVRGEVPVHEANRELGLSLPESDRWSTVAGLVLSRSGRMLDPGESVTLDSGTRLEVVDASSRRVLRVRVHPKDE